MLALSAALAFYLFIRITKTKSVDLRAIIAVAVASIAISNPLRLKTQQYFTTLSDVSQVKIKNLNSYKFGKMALYKVHTAESIVKDC
tara:strand:+ start:79 stop:339 length:261 start_codon:yes stop_codon:yes gene_type:complete